MNTFIISLIIAILATFLLAFIIGLICIKFFPNKEKTGNEDDSLKLIIGESDGRTTIAQSEIFASVDPKFKDWGLDKKGEATPEIEVDVYENEKEEDAREYSTFEEEFACISNDFDRLILTQGQIVDFCIKYLGHLMQLAPVGFLIKRNDNGKATADNLFVITITVSKSNDRKTLSAHINPFNKIVQGAAEHILIVPRIEI